MRNSWHSIFPLFVKVCPMGTNQGYIILSYTLTQAYITCLSTSTYMCYTLTRVQNLIRVHNTKMAFLHFFLRLAIINLLTLYGILITIIFILYNFLKFLISKLLILIHILYLLPSVFYRHTLIWYIKSFLVNFFYSLQSTLFYNKDLSITNTNKNRQNKWLDMTPCSSACCDKGKCFDFENVNIRIFFNHLKKMFLCLVVYKFLYPIPAPSNYFFVKGGWIVLF